jgi:hypothetical protein
MTCEAMDAAQVPAQLRPLSQHLGLAPALWASSGDFLLLYGAAVAFLATRARAPVAVIWLLVVGDVAWGVASVGIVLAGDVARMQHICVRSGSDARRGLHGDLG